MDKTIQKFNRVSMQLSKQVKFDSKPNPYSYMTLASSNFFSIFLSVVQTTNSEGFDFSYKSKLIKSINALSKKEIQTLYKYFMMDYFPYVEYAMKPMFKTMFPIKFETFINDFASAFKLTPSEQEILQQINEQYDSAYHSRLLLKIMGVPQNVDDLYLIETIEEIKNMIFNQFNKKVVTLLKLRKEFEK